MSCRYNAEVKQQAEIQAQLEKAEETFKEFERKDIKLREDMKHLKTKLKKLSDKIAKDAVKVQVAPSFK